jgi:hypothetical protein
MFFCELINAHVCVMQALDPLKKVYTKVPVIMQASLNTMINELEKAQSDMQGAKTAAEVTSIVQAHMGNALNWFSSIVY